MSSTLVVLSMLHERADVNSATRQFRGEAVVTWTLRRVAAAEFDAVEMLCWDDQFNAVASAAPGHAFSVGPRRTIAAMEAVSASRRWADGWRGGLLGACEFDRGFDARLVAERLQARGRGIALLVDPAAALVDPAVLRAVAARPESASIEYAFSQAPPGLGGVALTKGLIAQLAAAATHLGRFLSFLPDQVMRDPIATPACVPVEAAVSRSTDRFTLDSDRQIARLTAALAPLNGTLSRTDAAGLVACVAHAPTRGGLPRDLTLELTTRRNASPVWQPPVEPRDLSREMIDAVLTEIARSDDTRLTLAGRGDPLLHPDFAWTIDRARALGVHALHVRTDLLPDDPAALTALTAGGIDVVSVLIPALRPDTYLRLMGVDQHANVLKNVRTFFTSPHAGMRTLFVPVFVKLAANLDEMEPWYDQWLRAVQSAVIEGPGGCGGGASHAVADMSPARRTACRRLDNRLTILADGKIVSCEEDVAGRQPLGHVGTHSLADVWANAAAEMSDLHHRGRWHTLPVCSPCTEWHRP